MEDLSSKARYHRDRAQNFRGHADIVKDPSTRQMYLRLAYTEEALAERAKSLANEENIERRRQITMEQYETPARASENDKPDGSG